MNSTMPSAIPLEPRARGYPVPLTASQLRFWHVSVDRGMRRSKLRCCAASRRILGSLDIGLLREAILSIVCRHESLRTRIVGAPDAPQQIVNDRPTVDMPVIDLTGSPSDQRESTARRLTEEFLEQEIDLASDPLFAARILRLADQDHVLVLGIDHFVSDAVSFQILTREILTQYRQLSGSTADGLPPLSVQFPDFAVWQARTQDAWLRHHAPYWKERLASAPDIRVPTDRPRLFSEYPSGDFLYIPFGKKLSSGLQIIAQRERTLMPLIVLSIQLVIMSLWCERSDLLVEFFAHGRSGCADLKSMIGSLAYPMYLRIDVIEAESFSDLARRVTEAFYSAFAHDASRATGNLIREAPTELVFNWIQTGGTRGQEDVDRDGRRDILPFPVTKNFTGKFGPHYFPTPYGLIAEIWYGRSLFEERTLEWFKHGMRDVAEAVVRDTGTYIASLQSLCAR